LKLLLHNTSASQKSNGKRMKTKAKLIASLKIWVVIYPSITLFLYLLGKPLSVLPLYQRTLLLTIALVPWIVFIGVPVLNFIIHLISPENEKK
jgi:antibiotic biosynthesis monooxygenase (ABM) superfamily enzyme